MPYTLTKGLLWYLLALLIGFVIGWLMRSVVAKRQIARARNHHVDSAEMERLRGRVANLEPAVNERDRLRAELAECRAAASGRAAPPAAEAAPAAFADLSDTAPPERPPLDVSGAAAVLGRAVSLDDLQVVEGIGPKIAELCHGIGITTWQDLSVTEVSLLRTMLADAGSRFRNHDPGTWPQQAALLAAGRWGEFKALTDTLDGGRTVDTPPA